MKISKMLSESFECVKINGILRNLTNDEMKIYKRVKNEGKLFKADLTEFEANVATSMVTKGLLRRKKAQQENGKHGRIYYVARGRSGHLKSKPLEEVAPPDKKIESWIKKNKKRFKDRYGDGYEKYLYGRAWKAYNGKLTESLDYDKLDDITVRLDKDVDDEDIKKAKELAINLLHMITDRLDRAEEASNGVMRTEIARKKAYLDIFGELYEDGFFNKDDPANYILDNFVVNDDDYLYDELFLPFRDQVYEDAIESGEYDQYGEREYNSDATWEAIYDYGDIDLIDEYNDFGDFEDFANDVVENLDKSIEAIENPQIVYIPWSGEENEEVNQQQVQAANNQKRAEVIENLKHKFSDVYEIRELVGSLLDARETPNRNQLNTIENFCSNYEFYHNRIPAQEFDSILTPECVSQIGDGLHELENRWESYRDRARDAAIESGNFDQFDDAEYDSEATRDEVDNHSFEELLGNLSYFENYYKTVLMIKRILEKVVEVCDNTDGTETSTGEEFDESVSYKF